MDWCVLKTEPACGAEIWHDRDVLKSYQFVPSVFEMVLKLVWLVFFLSVEDAWFFKPKIFPKKTEGNFGFRRNDANYPQKFVTNGLLLRENFGQFSLRTNCYLLLLHKMFATYSFRRRLLLTSTSENWDTRLLILLWQIGEKKTLGMNFEAQQK